MIALMPYTLKDSVRHKFTKKAYNVRDWEKYDEGLKNRGSLTIWFSEDAIAAWNHVQPDKRIRGGQRVYSDLAIETAHTLRLVYKQPSRQTEGLLTSIVQLLNLKLPIPDYTTLSRRAKRVVLSKPPKSSSDSRVVIVDSTGLKVVGEKEWMNHKHGTKQRKVWRKLHLAVNEDGEILSATLTTHHESDVSQVPDLLNKIETPIDAFYGDAGGYDHPGTYAALDNHEQRFSQTTPIRTVIPPNIGFRSAQISDSEKRKANIKLLNDVGREKWQEATSYGKRSGVENTNSRYKTIIGGKLRSKDTDNQSTEVQIGIRILNRMRALGIPKGRRVA